MIYAFNLYEWKWCAYRRKWFGPFEKLNGYFTTLEECKRHYS